MCRRKKKRFADLVCFINLILTSAPLEHGDGLPGERERDVKRRPRGIAVNKLVMTFILFKKINRKEISQVFSSWFTIMSKCTTEKLRDRK